MNEESLLRQNLRVPQCVRHRLFKSHRTEFTQPLPELRLTVLKDERGDYDYAFLAGSITVQQAYRRVDEFKRKLQRLPQLVSGIHLAAPLESALFVSRTARRRKGERPVFRSAAAENRFVKMLSQTAPQRVQRRRREIQTLVHLGGDFAGEELCSAQL